MTENRNEALDRAFAALGDGTRRAILSRLTTGEAPLSDLAAPFEMSQTAVSKHVRVLSEAGLVTVEKRGRTRFCRLSGDGLDAAAGWIEDHRRFWTESLEALGRFLEHEGTGSAKAKAEAETEAETAAETRAQGSAARRGDQ